MWVGGDGMVALGGRHHTDGVEAMCVADKVAGGGLAALRRTVGQRLAYSDLTVCPPVM